jgi:hypothetical protein
VFVNTLRSWGCYGTGTGLEAARDGWRGGLLVWVFFGFGGERTGRKHGWTMLAAPHALAEQAAAKQAGPKGPLA